MLIEIFKDAYIVFSKAFKYIVLVSLFVNIPRNVIIVSIPSAWIPSFDMLLNMDPQELFTVMLPLWAVMYIIWIVFDPLIIAAFTYIAIITLTNRQVELTGILDNTLQKWPLLIITAFLYNAILIIGTMFFIIPGIYAMVVLTFHIVVVVARAEWGFTALAESFRVIKNNFFKTAFMIILTSALGMIINNLITYARYFEADFANRAANVLILSLRDTYTGYFTMVLIMYYFYLTKTKEEQSNVAA